MLTPVSRSPAETYLKYLLACGYDNRRIREVCRWKRLDYLGEPYLHELRGRCVPPTPFKPMDDDHGPSRRFLREHGIEQLFRPDHVTEAAIELMEAARAKEAIETLSIGRSTPGLICSVLVRKGFRATPAVVVRFQHYFFNLDGLGETEVKAVLAARYAPEPTSDPDERVFNECLVEAAKHDPRVLAAEMGVTPMADLINMLRLGVMPNVDVGRLASATRATAAARAFDCSVRGDKAAKDYTAIAAMMGDVLEKVGEPELDLQEELTGFVLRTEERQLPHIKELSGGHHTLNVQPIDAESDTDEAEQ